MGESGDELGIESEITQRGWGGREQILLVATAQPLPEV